MLLSETFTPNCEASACTGPFVDKAFEYRVIVADGECSMHACFKGEGKSVELVNMNLYISDASILFMCI